MRGRASRSRSSTGSRPPRRRRWWPPGSSRTRDPATSSPTCSVGAAGWHARPIDRQRLAVSLESTPLSRMLAEVVLRPPDVRHLDAAFQGMAASPRGTSSLKVSIGDMFATRCATCSRTLVVDEIAWSVDDEAGIAGRARPVTRHYRCMVCRDQRGGSEQRQAPLDADDRNGRRRMSVPRRCAPPPGALPDRARGGGPARRAAGPAHGLASSSASAPSSSGSRATCARARSSRRCGWRSSTRSCRPAGSPRQPGRTGALRVSSGHVRPQSGIAFRERNPWLAFEDAFRLVRGFIQRLEAGTTSPIQARLGEDLRSLGEGAATTVLALVRPRRPGRVRDDSERLRRTAPDAARPARPRPAADAPEPRPARASPTTARPGCSVARRRRCCRSTRSPAAPLRAPWSWQATADCRRPGGRRAVDGTRRPGRPDRRGRAGGDRRAVLGGATAGYRLVSARLADADDDAAGDRRARSRRARALPPGAADARATSA